MKSKFTSMVIGSIVISTISIILFPAQWDPVFFRFDRNFRYNRESRETRIETIQIMTEAINAMSGNGEDTSTEERLLQQSIKRMREATSHNYVDFILSKYIFRKNLDYPNFK